MRIKIYVFIVILIGSLIGSANMKEVKAEDSESIEDIVELSLFVFWFRCNMGGSDRNFMR